MKNKDNALGWLFSQAGDRKKAFALSVLCAFISVLCSLAPYYFIAKMVHLLISGEKNFESYLPYIGYVALFFAGEAIFHALSTALSHVNTFAIIANVREATIDKIAKMPLGDVLEHKPGELKSTMMERIDSIETTLAHVVPEFTSNLSAPIILLIVIFRINWKMGIAAFITIPLGFACYLGMMIGYEEKYGRTVRAGKALNDASVEYIGGIEVVKVFGKSENSYKKFVDAAKELAQSFVDWMSSCQIFFTIAIVVMPASMLTVLPIGGLMYMHGNISGEALIDIIIISIALVAPIIRAFGYMDDIEQIGAITGEIRTILDAKEMERPEVSEYKEKLTDKNVILNNVHFAYQEKEVLHGINMEIKDGEFIALVGPSGSGKSTIAKLIAGLWDVNEGSISYGGKDIRKIPFDIYNKKIAFVSQDNYLFNLSVKENIAMGKMDGTATDEEVIEVAKKSGCHDFIMSLENGYETVVGSSGGHLSGGERQRISIARAMLKNADLIILDEATAYTDPENEAIIQKSVAKLVQGKTLIVIAHRLSTIKDADKIYCIVDGNIKEQGKHDELLAMDGVYNRMWQAHVKAKDAENVGGER